MTVSLEGEGAASQLDFFGQQFVVQAKNKEQFQKFLKTYNAEIINEGTIPQRKDKDGKLLPHVRNVTNDWKLVRIKAPDVTAEELAQTLGKKGFKGKVRVSSQEAMNMYQIVMSDQGLNIEPNYAMKPAQVQPAALTQEHYKGGGTQYTSSFDTPYSYWWMNEARGGNVLRAWNELNVSGQGVNIAIIDVGFLPNDFDVTAYNPFVGNYGGGSGMRWYVNQYNFHYGAPDPYDVTADAGGDRDYNGATYHGYGVTSVAVAANNNQYGVSGVAPKATPFLFRVGRSPSGLYSYYDAGRAVDTATAWGAHIINMSFYANTYGEAGVPNTQLGDTLQRAENAGIINVASYLISGPNSSAPGQGSCR